MAATMVTAVYRAFRAAGVEDDVAQAAAEAVSSSEAALTRADLAGIQTEIAKLRTDLHAMEAGIAWRVSTIVVSALLAATGMFALIVNWLLRP